MAATTSQGRTFTLFMAGLTAACAGIAYFTTGSGKISCVIGLIALAISAAGFLKLKPLEGKTATPVQPVVMKLVGIAALAAGFYVVLIGIHLASSVSGRMVTTLIGFAIELVGMLYFLPTASSKNAIWKA